MREEKAAPGPWSCWRPLGDCIARVRVVPIRTIKPACLCVKSHPALSSSRPWAETPGAGSKKASPCKGAQGRHW